MANIRTFVTRVFIQIQSLRVSQAKRHSTGKLQNCLEHGFYKVFIDGIHISLEDKYAR